MIFRFSGSGFRRGADSGGPDPSKRMQSAAEIGARRAGCPEGLSLQRPLSSETPTEHISGSKLDDRRPVAPQAPNPWGSGRCRINPGPPMAAIRELVPKGGRSRSKFGRHRGNFGRVRPRLGPNLPKSGQFGSWRSLAAPLVVEFGPIWVDPGPNLVGIWAKTAQRSKPAHIRPFPGQTGRVWSTVPNWGGVWPELNRIRPDSDGVFLTRSHAFIYCGSLGVNT